MTMKYYILALMALLGAELVSSQPRPYEIDTSFVPQLEFMQKTWTGEYDGLEPNSKMILSISRELILNTDLTYTNIVTGRIKQQSEEKLLRYESGKYQYTPDARALTYFIKTDSTLDINILLQGGELSYTVNHYKEDGTQKTMTESLQFSFANNDAERLWVLFDQLLMSPIDPRQKAVYVLTGKPTESSTIKTVNNNFEEGNCFSLTGRLVQQTYRGVVIKNHRKVIKR